MPKLVESRAVQHQKPRIQTTKTKTKDANSTAECCVEPERMKIANSSASGEAAILVVIKSFGRSCPGHFLWISALFLYFLFLI